ncbi:MAG TPA: class I SAM-dependent methyltransferase [Melioribacteraceae bacterium]|nr:class I SAM-dependent methyltransferase [Melioribacteraceae bacterium]
MSSDWIAYNELAWVDDLLSDPDEYSEEVSIYNDLIKRNSRRLPETLLHFGSGAGGHDAFFKEHFNVTGVDLSTGMLNKARARHPEIEYIEGDMRTVRLNRLFDAVVIPDSIDYMASEENLNLAVMNASRHLKPGGVLLIVGKTFETFSNNNFAYTGEKDGIHLTVLENNYINPYKPGTYEAAIFYLIRKEGELTVRSEIHHLGLFPESVWDKAFADAGLELKKEPLNGLYQKNLLGEGEYPLTIFLGIKPE